MKRKLLTGIIASVTIIGGISMTSAADSWKDGSGDEFEYYVYEVNRTHASVVCIVNVTNFESGTVT